MKKEEESKRITLSLTVNRTGNLLEETFLCPECGETHVINDPQEIAKESLYCDKFKKRIPYPEEIRSDVKKVKSIRFDDLTDEEKARFKANERLRGFTIKLPFGK